MNITLPNIHESKLLQTLIVQKKRNKRRKIHPILTKHAALTILSPLFHSHDDIATIV